MVDFFSFALGTQISADAAWRDEVSGIGDYVFLDVSNDFTIYGIFSN